MDLCLLLPPLSEPTSLKPVSHLWNYLSIIINLPNFSLHKHLHKRHFKSSCSIPFIVTICTPNCSQNNEFETLKKIYWYFLFIQYNFEFKLIKLWFPRI